MIWLDYFIQAFVTALAWIAAACTAATAIGLAGWLWSALLAALPFRRRR